MRDFLGIKYEAIILIDFWIFIQHKYLKINKMTEISVVALENIKTIADHSNVKAQVSAYFA